LLLRFAFVAAWFGKPVKTGATDSTTDRQVLYAKMTEGCLMSLPPPIVLQSSTTTAEYDRGMGYFGVIDYIQVNIVRLIDAGPQPALPPHCLGRREGTRGGVGTISKILP